MAAAAAAAAAPHVCMKGDKRGQQNQFHSTSASNTASTSSTSYGLNDKEEIEAANDGGNGSGDDGDHPVVDKAPHLGACGRDVHQGHHRKSQRQREDHLCAEEPKQAANQEFVGYIVLVGHGPFSALAINRSSRVKMTVSKPLT
eukprot:TRINITY_DN1490_c0_g1_i2.p1 TRINITY_DN1490_c0_g1~~TRINITY_DN1490_c0_g1_i2.p1  ORF type:complete len:144 (-),score=22.70 TRINITY_DN1490_c0_g1_i2:141-572(-)